MLSFLRRHMDKLVFAWGMAAVVFAYGIAVAKYQVFSHAVLQAAFDAGRDWRDNWRHHLGIRSNWVNDSDRPGGVSRHDPARAWNGLTFINLYRHGAFGGILLDMQGGVLHEWTLPIAEIWQKAGLARPPMPDVDAAPHGARMLPNGDLILALAGYALVRLDACSRVVWSLPVRAHHSIDVVPNGDILVPGSVEYHEPISKWPRLRLGPSGYFQDELIVRVSPDGKVLEEISISDVLYQSGWMALLFAGRGSDYAMAENDPYHVNDIEQLRPEMAAAFPMFAAGDLLVDLRNLQTMIVLDGTTHRVKWTMTGPFLASTTPTSCPTATSSSSITGSPAPRRS